MKYYAIRVQNYDLDNTTAYILDSKLFETMQSAMEYLEVNGGKIIQDHWTRCLAEMKADGANINENYQSDGFEILDMDDGSSLEVDIIVLFDKDDDKPMEKRFRIPYMEITREDLESRGFDSSKVSDDEMQMYAGYISKCIQEWECDWGLAVSSTLEYYNVPLKQETEE